MAISLTSQVKTVIENTTNRFICNFFGSPVREQQSSNRNWEPQSPYPIKTEVLTDEESDVSRTMQSQDFKYRRRKTYGVRIRPKGASGIRRFKVTQRDLQAMAHFICRLGRKPRTTDWETFYYSVSAIYCSQWDGHSCGWLLSYRKLRTKRGLRPHGIPFIPSLGTV